MEFYEDCRKAVEKFEDFSEDGLKRHVIAGGWPLHIFYKTNRRLIESRVRSSVRSSLQRLTTTLRNVDVGGTQRSSASSTTRRSSTSSISITPFSRYALTRRAQLKGRRSNTLLFLRYFQV